MIEFSGQSPALLIIRVLHLAETSWFVRVVVLCIPLQRWWGQQIDNIPVFTPQVPD